MLANLSAICSTPISKYPNTPLYPNIVLINEPTETFCNNQYCKTLASHKSNIE